MGKCSSCCQGSTPNSDINIEQLKSLPGSEKAAVVVQSVMKTYLENKRVQKISERRAVNTAAPYESNFQQHEPQEYLGEGEDEEGYQNATVAEIAKRLGDFDYGAAPEDGVAREYRECILFQNGAQYEGEWNINTGERDGRGVQVWADGSRYEGYWKNDKANGRGRLIHADGDVYEGEWKDDKSHGYGVYLHSDGAQYQGEWADDK